jgi:hypothetical protein
MAPIISFSPLQYLLTLRSAFFAAQDYHYRMGELLAFHGYDDLLALASAPSWSCLAE